MSKQERLQEQKEESDRALRIETSAKTHEREMVATLSEYLEELLEPGRWKELKSTFSKVRIHFLWNDNYRINFWVKKNEYCEEIQYSFFTSHSKAKGFYYSDPSIMLLNAGS